MKQICLFSLVILFFYAADISAQSLAINTDGSTANASALLDVKSTAKGVLIPRMSRTERNAIASPAIGLLIFQNGPDSIGFHYYDGTKWTWMFSNANADSLAWRTKGNTGTTDAANFVGTVDDVPLNIKVNNQKSGRIASSGETFLGYQSGNVNTSGHSTGVGYQALASNTSGNDNTAIGREALRFNTTGAANTAAGKDALLSNTTGNSNVAAGYQALLNNSTGTNNTGIGTNALRGNTTAVNNTALGYDAMRSNTTGSENVAIGTHALTSNLTGTKNVAIAGASLYFNTSGDQNVAIGYYNLFSNSTGSQNVSVGEGNAVFNTTGSANTMIGFQSLYSNTTGYSNVAVGVRALYSNGTSSNLVAVGDSSLISNTGIFNTAVGSKSMFRNTTGGNNTAHGFQSLYNNTTANNNVALGYQALYNNSSGSSNVGLGIHSLYNNTISGNLVAIGDSSLHNSTGAGNTAIGSKAGYNVTTGTDNVFLGHRAGYNVTTGSNKLYIANNTTDPPIIYGDFSNKTLGFGTITPNSTYGYAKVEIASEGFLAPADLLIRNAADNAGYAPGLVFQHARGTLATPVTVNNGDYLSAIKTMNYDGSNYILSAGLDIFADGPVSANIVPTRMHFNTMNSTGGYSARLTIKNDGKTGIGTTNPSAKLHVGGGTRFTVLDTGAIFLQSGNLIGSARDWKIAVTLPNGYLSFRDMGFDNTGTGAMATDAMVIAWGTGNVGIGTSAPSSKLEVCGDVRVIGTIVASGSITTSAITCPSDLRYKTKISPLKNPVQKLMQLHGVNYYWKANEFPNMNFSNNMQVGFIAQEVEKIFPEMVFTDNAGYKSIDYSRLTPVLVETIKEQQKQITDMNTRLHEIEKMLIK